jgi:putative endopeptidase
MVRTTLKTLAAVALAAAGCAHETGAKNTTAPRTTWRSLADVGLDGSAMDKSVDPCQDFYHYACGNWIKSTPIPADKARWVRSFNVIDESNKAALKEILESASKATEGNEVTKKIGAYYGACMNEDGIEKYGALPVEKYIGIARSVKDKDKDARSLMQAIIELHKAGFFVLFNISANQDGNDATKVIAALDQNGLGLPDRDYYLDQSDHMRDIRTFYEGHVDRMLEQAGDKDKAAASGAKDVLALETELAQISKSKVERRDPKGMYNKVDLAGVKKLMPHFPWDEYLKALGHPDITEISVTSPAYFEGLDRILTHTKPAVWRSYLEWHVLHGMAHALTKKIVDENFSLTQKLTGQDKLPERWKRCVEATDGALGELVGQSYVQQKFSGDSKSATENAVREIRSAFAKNLASLDWMDDATRKRASDKLDKVSFLIGYPEKWKEYAYDISPTDYAANEIASSIYELQRDLNKIGKPLDRSEWDMTPATVNAYYNPQKNQMVFPAGILQTPFFNANASVAVNLGGIGFVIGHELTHGFDDEGAQFDAVGNLANWWSTDVNARFMKKGQCIADQYSTYSPVPGANVNGKLTEGENIADNGGLKLAFRAYRSLRANAPERILADGINEDQQFFIAAAQVWCAVQKPEDSLRRVKTDPHSPAQFRVMGPLSNTPEFWEAFKCQPGTPMHPVNACSVW